LPRAVSGASAVVGPAEKVAVSGTVAMPVLPELRLTVTPPVGALAERVSVRFCEEFRPTVMLEGEKVTVAVPLTDCVAVV